MLTASSYSEIERQLAMGNRNKSVAATHMNDVSSRAHTIFSIKFSQTELEQLSGDESHLARETKKVSHINLVDLAGSERQTSKQLSTWSRCASRRELPSTSRYPRSQIAFLLCTSSRRA